MWTTRRLSSTLRSRLQASRAVRQWPSAIRSNGFHAGRAPLASAGYLTDVSFESLPISRTSKDVLTGEMGYEFLTHVQNDTLPLVLEGRDVLAKGKTGNGKTIAFLLPALERMLANQQTVAGSPGKISALVISPTRELAQQIAVEAVKLTNAHGMRTACFVGGSSVNKDVKELSQSRAIDVLVTTPGRLQAHLTDNSGRIRQKLENLQVLVLDEADRLLDMGFRPDIMRIISHLPKNRQTLLFSATLPAATEELKDVALRDDYAFVDTIQGDDQQTNTQTVQEFVVCDLQDVIPMVEGVLEEHMQLPEFKVLVFLPTARSAQFMAQLFQAAGFANVLEMHSRKSQAARTKASDAFRKGKKVVMFSSDVSARGVDYPDVSLVLQVGLTDRDQYIHRLGRTARAGMEGRGVLVLADFEKPLLKDLKDLPLTELAQRPQLEKESYRTTRTLAGLRPHSELEQSAQKAYQAFLGFYNSNLKKLGMSKTDLVETGALYSQLIGLQEVPQLQKKTLRAMGLLDTPGLTAAPKATRVGGPGRKGPGGELGQFGANARNDSRRPDRFGYEGRRPIDREFDSPTKVPGNRAERRASQRFDGHERREDRGDREGREDRGDREGRGGREYRGDREGRGSREYRGDRGGRGGRGDRERGQGRSFDGGERKSFRGERSFEGGRGRRSASADGDRAGRGRRDDRRDDHKRSSSAGTKRNYKEPHKRY
ncbi:hypothetical protein BBJ28_00002656 [Nothophytophthora sp. Chile5]|nr:hypothetical protein BBJ28_00002656 [Nothophytophthora sp. Chile5]